MSSWLTGIASKATSILESVDEYAASSIQSIVTTATGTEAEDAEETKKRDPPLSLPVSSSNTWSYPSPVELGEGAVTKPLNFQIPPSSPITENKTEMSDEKLMEFLNTPKAPTPLTEISLSSPPQESAKLLPPDIVKTALSSQDLPVYSNPGPDTLAAENDNLRRAFTAGKAELELMQEHWHQSQRQVSTLTRDLSQLRQELSEREEREKRLRDDLETREGQLEAQGVQIEVMKRELERNQSLLQENEPSNDREEQPSPPGVVSALRVELATLHTQLDSTQASREQETTTLQRQIDELTVEQVRLTTKVTRAEQRSRELENRCEHLQTQLGVAGKELSDYKQKATAVLQAKEKLILDLQRQITVVPVDKGRSDEEHTQQVKMLEEKYTHLGEEMRKMEDESVEKIAELSSKLDRTSQENSLLSSQLSFLHTQAEEKETSLRTQERQNEALRSQLASQQGDVTARDVTIRELEGQLARAVSHSDPSSQELQGRVRSLTDTVILKQRSIEALGGENNTLKLQLDKLTQRLSQSDSLLSEPSGKSKLRHITSLPLPQACPSRLGRNFESAVTRLDLVSLRVGVFFRQYPYARLFSLLYLLMFHLCFFYLLIW